MVSQTKEGIDSLVKKQLPVDSLMKKQLPVDSLVKKQLPVDSLVKKQLPVDSLVKKQLPVDSLVKKQLPVDSLVKKQLPVDSLVKKQLPVDSLVKTLHGQDCDCTNSGDGDAGDWSAVFGCVVGKSCGRDFLDEKVPLMRIQTMKASRPFLILCLGCRRVKLRIRAPTMAETETTNLTLAAA
ncbi:hypothetical protein BgiBS90_030150 [Biomphalaria glabrata]|nr:hypothetical protein BgiBS90_030150 [Biomphalaria glabrata]